MGPLRTCQRTTYLSLDKERSVVCRDPVLDYSSGVPDTTAPRRSGGSLLTLTGDGLDVGLAAVSREADADHALRALELDPRRQVLLGDAVGGGHGFDGGFGLLSHCGCRQHEEGQAGGEGEGTGAIGGHRVPLCGWLRISHKTVNQRQALL